MTNMNNYKKIKAVYKDDAVRCEKCGVEIWAGVDCDCGIDGEDHEGIEEAYEEKNRDRIAEIEKGV